MGQIPECITVLNTAKALARAAGDRVEEKIADLQEDEGIDRPEAFHRDEVKGLRDEARQLWHQADAASRAVILHNLELLGLQDMQVCAQVEVQDAKSWQLIRTAQIGPTQLSELSAESRRLRDEVEIDGGKERLELRLTVTDLAGETIGVLDSDRQFHFHAAPNAETAIKWLLATGIGSGHVINLGDGFQQVNVAKMATDLAGIVQGNGTGKSTFFDVFMTALEKVMVYEVWTQFADGYCSWATTLWKVVTRTLLGQEHPGYPFAY